MKTDIKYYASGATPFVTIGPEHGAWRGTYLNTEEEIALITGAFVRLRPPKDVDPEYLRDVELVARQHALAVKTERAKVDRVVHKGLSKLIDTSAANIRGHVLEMASDKPELSQLLDRIMIKNRL